LSATADRRRSLQPLKQQKRKRYMKFNTKVKLSILILSSLLIGAYMGGQYVLHIVKTQNKALHNHYVDSRILSIISCLSTNQKIKKEKFKDVIVNNAMLIQKSFIELVDIHKTGDYSGRNEQIVLALKDAKKYINKNQKIFDEQEAKFRSSMEKQMGKPEVAKTVNDFYKKFDDSLDYTSELKL